MDDFDRENPIFESIVPFRIQQTDRETKHHDYMVRILSGTKGSTSAQRQRALCIEITEDNEPVFYHSLCVSENEFTDLKTDQSILVDFAAFPTLFIELLEQVIASKHESSPRYAALVTIRDPAPGSLSTLSIIETNRFKQLTHLQLSFRIGNDTIVKRYLANRLTQTKTIVQRCRKSIEILEQEVQTAKFNQDNANTEIQRLRTDIETQEANLRVQYTNELSVLKETLLKEKTGMEDHYRQIMEDTRTKNDQHVNDLSNQLKDANNTVTMVRNEMVTLQRTLRDHSSRITSLTDDLSTGQDEINRLRKSLHEADEARTLSAKEAAAQITRIAVLEQQLYDQKNILEQTQALLEASRNEASKAEDSKTFFKGMYDRANEKLELSANEIKKGNTVITQLQEEYRTVKAKQKMKSEALRSTEERLSEREHTITNLQRELDTTKVNLDREHNSRDQLEQTLETVKGQLSAAREAIQEQQGVIAWLNKTLTEATTNGAIPANPRTYLAATAASAAAMVVTNTANNNNNNRKPNGSVSTSFVTTVPQIGSVNNTTTTSMNSALPRPSSASSTPFNPSSIYARTPSTTTYNGTTNPLSSPDILSATSRTLPSSTFGNTLSSSSSNTNPTIASMIGTTAAVVANAATLTRTPIGSSNPPSSSLPPNSTNPYLAGTIPLSDALNTITSKAFTNSTNKVSSSTSAYFSGNKMNTSNGSIPGGGPPKAFTSRTATPVNTTGVTNTL